MVKIKRSVNLILDGEDAAMSADAESRYIFSIFGERDEPEWQDAIRMAYNAGVSYALNNAIITI